MCFAGHIIGTDNDEDGIPFNEITLGRMDPVERQFWDNFRKIVADDIAKVQGEPPYVPSIPLWTQFNIGVKHYAGAQYAEVKRLPQIFKYLRIK